MLYCHRCCTIYVGDERPFERRTTVSVIDSGYSYIFRHPFDCCRWGHYSCLGGPPTERRPSGTLPFPTSYPSLHAKSTLRSESTLVSGVPPTTGTCPSGLTLCLENSIQDECPLPPQSNTKIK